MFQSYQYTPLRQQVITLTQNYPCPRCHLGVLEPSGLTETFRCGKCERSFVPLKGGCLLYPSKRMRVKIAPTFWWDGLHWHWAGTTASTSQLLSITLIFSLPLLLSNYAIYFNMWNERPEWLSAPLLSIFIGLFSIQLIYLIYWDFDFFKKQHSPETSTQQ